MTMRPIYVLILMLSAGISSNAQSYDYDTTLKGGYSLSFKTDDSLQYLYLKKGNKIITELSSASKGLLPKNLGYTGADFTNYFVLVHSFGSGNPHYIQLIKKETGENVLKSRAAWIDADKEREFLLYSDNDVPDKQDKMTLFNIKTDKNKHLLSPMIFLMDQKF